MILVDITGEVVSELKILVVTEATKLKSAAADYQLSRLNFDVLDPVSPSQCIYGQMTGGCYSVEAFDLLNQCAIPYAESIITDADYDEYDYEDEALRIKRVMAKNFKRSKDSDHISRYFSPIEFYITLRQAKNNVLIDFLKGDRETLTVEDL